MTALRRSSPPESVVAAVRERLEAVERVDDPLGQAALVLAGILDSDAEGTSARVAAGKELRVILTTIGGPPAVGAVDELRRRREHRLLQGRSS